MLDHLQRWSRHPLAYVLIFLWAFAEATLFPIAPDLLLVFLALGRPSRWLAFGLLALAGSLAGGLTTYADAASGGPFLSGRPILVTPRMEADALRSLEELGAAALLVQAFGGVPYKVYAALAPAAGISPQEFILASALGRGARLLPVVAIVAFMRRWLAGLIEQHFGWVAVTVVIGFLTLLALGVFIVA